MPGEPERRRALLRALGEALRTVKEAVEPLEEFREELRNSILGTLEESTGLAIRPETRALLRIYDLTPPPQPGMAELKRMLARSLGLDPEEVGELDPGELIRKALAGGPGAESTGPRREAGAGAREEA